MADRKKVPKIRARRVGNSTAKKNAKATKEFHKTKTESIRMNSQNNKTVYGFKILSYIKYFLFMLYYANFIL